MPKGYWFGYAWSPFSVGMRGGGVEEAIYSGCICCYNPSRLVQLFVLIQVAVAFAMQFFRLSLSVISVMLYP